MDGFKSRRLRIKERGLDNYTGMFGLVDFVDGVSVAVVGWQEAHLLGSNVRVVDADDETYQIGPVAETERQVNMLADSHTVRAVNTGVTQENGEIKLAVQKFSREELEEIASKKGLAGVRELARVYNKTGRSIQECITAVLDGQGDNPTQSTIEGPGDPPHHAD